ncbi:small acid-soluble spore protein H (minor) [Gracilibacillus ureilyticus]|uniref:Small, acid-soluble spore protein H n=1 Tax=Gracilibacillus ureilyticus TaxID=531814 RepID=A0A1H9M5W7_9BACI|nr:H-type small acid-soluble spore protein [Gracilibacillus ureilyticus]SER18951.1 small acid-soluble spore protein H (minor) [Gracilibacillus ureilyticus]
MDAERAQEILNSPDMFHVTHNGEKIYIEHVDRSNGQATVHPLHDPNKKYSVTIDQLMEQ